MKRAKRILSGACLVAAATFILAGCGSKNDPAPAKINVKYTVTIAGSDAEDNIYIQAAVGNHNASQYGEPCWKINGVTQGNQNVMELDEDDFSGSTKTYVLESVRPYDFASLKVECRNFSGAPVTVSYKAEINGVAQTNTENVSLAAGQDHSKSFTYTGK